jgi:hypothetical protein
MTTLSRKTLGDLKKRHIAFLEQRLVSPEAREEWIRAFADGYDQFLARPVREVIQPAALAKGLHKALSAHSVRTFFAPVMLHVHVEVLATLKENGTPIGDYVPAKAREAIEAILERRDLVPDALVRKVFEQQLVEDAIHDTLYEGLTQFNTTVNPFFADWGLPSILKRMPIGGSMILASMEAMRGEFDRRLEPEIRKFLAAFSRRATGELTELILTRSGDPRFLELRRNLLAFLYSQSLAELLAGVGEQTARHGAEAAEHVILGLLHRDRHGESLRAALQSFVDAQGDATVGDWLDGIGATGRPNLEGWAELLWPHVEGLVRSPVVGDFLRKITAEFYDGLTD